YLVPGKHGFALKVGFAAYEAGNCDKSVQYLVHFLTYATEDKYDDDRKDARKLLNEMLKKGCVEESALGGMHLSDEQRVERARELYEAGEEHAAAGRWSEATVAYEQAYQLVPSKVGFAHKVGLAAKEAGECDKAHQYLVHFVDYADPGKYEEQRSEATTMIRDDPGRLASGIERLEPFAELVTFEITERSRDEGKSKGGGGKGLLIGGAVLAGLGLGGVGVGVAGFVLAGRSQGQLDALATTATASGYPEGDYACRDVAADQCPPTLEDQIAKRQLMGLVGVAAGGALLLGGAALITVHVLRSRKSGATAEAHLQGLGPMLVRDGAGATATLAF
ncbi:MAG: hypothetical protein KC431_03535, partial [Myxococcales bacterium]|nr:hypothetical protein [Myxococcales bacterium]